MNRSSSGLLTLCLGLAGLTPAGNLDSVAIRFGAGVSKPFVEQRVTSSVPATGFSRKIHSQVAALCDLEMSLRRDRWEVGLALGIDGEVLSVQRLDATGFSVGHGSLLGGVRLLRYRESELWLQAVAGPAFPVFPHDEAAHAERLAGWRAGAGLAFVRGGTRVALGASRSQTGYSSKSRLATSESSWTHDQLYLVFRWDWISPGK